jgi:hypothetical protein
MHPKQELPSAQTYLRVRAEFVGRGESLNAWCLRNGIQRQNACSALSGKWRGRKADVLVEMIMEYLREQSEAEAA